MVDREARRWLGWSAAAGGGVWLAWGVALASGAFMRDRIFPSIDWLTLLGPLVIVPLGLRLCRLAAAGGADGDGDDTDAWPRITKALPLGMTCAMLSMVVGSGVAAAVLGGGYAVVTWLVARRGMARLMRRRPHGLAERAVDAGCLYLVVGGVMWTVARAGARPFGLGEPIVTLAATHFHFAAFALLVVAGETGRRLGAMHGAVRGPVRSVYVFGTSLAMVAPVGVAVGIIAWPTLEAVASVALSAAGACIAVVLVASVAPRVRPLLAGGLVTMAGLALLVGMGAAGTFAVGTYLGRDLLPVPLMVPLHGAANGVFFAVGALGGLAWARGAGEQTPT